MTAAGLKAVRSGQVRTLDFMLKAGQRIQVPDAEGAIEEATFLALGEQSQAEWVEGA
jgi:hypothetical protein